MITIETVAFDSDNEKRTRALAEVRGVCGNFLRPTKSATSAVAEFDERSDAGKILHAIVCAVRDDYETTIKIQGDGLHEIVKTQGDGSATRYHGPHFDVGVPYL